MKRKGDFPADLPEQKPMFTRTFQVYAVQHMVKRIKEDNGNRYIWHATRNGKTLTFCLGSADLIARRGE